MIMSKVEIEPKDNVTATAKRREGTLLRPSRVPVRNEYNSVAVRPVPYPFLNRTDSYAGLPMA
jgi:hypothetical protein